ncbi:MAG: hypothetical protein D6733_07420 [Methanobacteriota archaeon]|nr:MAG: hypothetical protein D6733_07420 [Euryarchaeota archaeon]
MVLKPILRKVGELQATHARTIFLLAIVLSAFMALGVPRIRLQTDLSKELPSGVPTIELQDRIGEKFGDSDVFLIVISLDPDSDVEGRVQDIRDPRVLEMVVELHQLLEGEPEVSSVFSIAPALAQAGVPPSLEASKEMLGRIPQASQAFNRDYTATVVFASTDLGADEERVRSFMRNINEDMEAVRRPPGVKIGVTGTPVMRTTLMTLLVRDATFTILLSAAVILGLLVLLHGPTRGLLIFVPLIGAMIWLLGTMGWLGIPLSIATVGIGAMVLGLGVEYGVFVVKRYEEERETGKSQLETLQTILPGVGLAIFGSASTTTVGFLALLLATMPMIQKMGATLALGIVYSFIAAVIVNPAFIVVEESFMEKRRERNAG